MVPHQRRYLPGTMVLETTWHTPTGWLIVQDLLVVRARSRTASGDPTTAGRPATSAATGTLLRMATCIEGHVEVVVNVVPGLRVRGPDRDVGLRRGRLRDHDGSPARRRPCADPDARASASARPAPAATGEPRWKRASPPSSRCRGRAASPTNLDEATVQLGATISYWRDWLSNGTFPDHPWRSYMERSALTLKGLSYAPTGAIMAAATTSLPETPGGARNWDYRYTWIRDSSFMLRSLYRLGFDWEALEYFAFVIEAVALTVGANSELQIMYGIDGRRDLTETTLDHLSGWRNSRPVRVGNGAWDQHQNDVWGMILDAVDIHLRRAASQIVKPVWEGVAKLVESAIAHAGTRTRASGRSGAIPQHFTASKVLCWVAMDRGADMARTRQDHDRAEQWRKAADDLKAEILDKGVDAQGRFRQHYGNDELDASLLLIPILELPAARRRAGAGHRARHRRRAHRGRPGPALQGRHHRHRLRGQGGHVHHLLLLAGDRAGHDRRGRAGPGPVPEAARLRQSFAALRRGDRRRDR